MKQRTPHQHRLFFTLALTLTLALFTLAACNNGGDATTNQTDCPACGNAYNEQTARWTFTRMEGDLVILDPTTIDPDGDVVTLAYDYPFDEHGQWKTTSGDAGTYNVLVVATDEHGARDTAHVNVVILPRDGKPIVDCPTKIVVKEGEKVSINCTITDDKGVKEVFYTGWMTAAEYKTTYEDAGTHTVFVNADDGEHLVSEEVTVIVQNVNRPPEFPTNFPDEIAGEAGDVFAISTAEVYDPDGDDVVFTYSDPFDQDGFFKSNVGDVGEYTIDVVASDGTLQSKRTVTVSVYPENTAPVLERIPDITVNEGSTIEIPLAAHDREGDELSYEISGWFDTPTRYVTYDEAGEYTVKVTVSDGFLYDSQVVHITVNDVNRAPIYTG